jgi:integrase/recombinase XerD
MDEEGLEIKVKQATMGMQRQCYNKLLRLGNGNSELLADYLLAYKRESDTKDSTRATTCLNLVRFAERINKPLKNVTREDVLGYFDSLRKPEELDPLNKWKGTWKLHLIHIPNFFKWLYCPEKPPKKRPVPDIVADIPVMKRKEKKTYEAEDMWDLVEDSEIFFKYCPLVNIKAYHAIALTGARPHEILKLKIKDIIWPPDGEHPYFVAVGKTGKRTIWIARFKEYVREWIEKHPQRNIPTSYIFCAKKIKGHLSEQYVNSIYTMKLKSYFSELLEDSIGQEDRKHIIRLLQKPWNLYIIRHSAATEVFRKNLLSRDLANQHFGWSENSNTAAKYEHLFHDDSEKRLAEALGSIIVKKEPPKLPRFVECYKCQHQNTPDVPFCIKCTAPISTAGYIERENKLEKSLQTQAELKEQMSRMKQTYQRGVGDREKKDREISELKEQISEFRKEFTAQNQRVGILLETLRENPEWQKSLERKLSTQK